DLRNLTLTLLSALRSHILSRSLPSKSGSSNFQSDLLRLISAATSDNFEFDSVKSLLKSALSNKVDDFTIWDQAYSAVPETTPPPPNDSLLTSTNALAT
ncbi:hypothetical protein CABS01_16680, partial [Colletotrichum abscissum]|uniref:uncharacterized protein n=1 Tax=Colletotrichum abscissum TaxID=1671311 RepID=UPI0027D5E681